MKKIPPEAVALAVILGITAIAAFAVVLLTGQKRGAVSAPPTPVAMASAHVRSSLPAIVPGPLDGLPIARGIASRRPIAVVFDNFYPDGRPQWGISRASLVFEALVEGGITRLLGVFLEHEAAVVGPIRSARPYFVSWAAGYHALFVHSGGSPAAQRLVRRVPQLANIDALVQHPQFQRRGSNPEPHNLFGSTVGARALVLRNEWPGTPQFPLLVHKNDAPLTQRGPGRVITIDFSTRAVNSPASYVVTYRYARRRNTYRRFVGGSSSIDGLTHTQIEARNVLVLFSPVSPIPGDTQGRVRVGAIGSGEARLYRDGRVIVGRWQKSSMVDALHFWNNKGRVLALNRGQTWIEVVPPGAIRSGR